MEMTKKEFLKIKGEVVLLREIIKQMGWGEVHRIKAETRQQQDAVKRGKLMAESERLVLFLGQFDKEKKR